MDCALKHRLQIIWPLSVHQPRRETFTLWLVFVTFRFIQFNLCIHHHHHQFFFHLSRPLQTQQYQLSEAAAANGPPYHQNSSLYTYSAQNYGSLDQNAATRRKNATRETTNTLKAWLYEHRKNPYPTKGEKIMLAIITKMTLTQVGASFVPMIPE